MTIHELQRAALVLFAAREVANPESLQAMKALCFVIRNRVKKGWHDSNWLTILEHAPEVSGNLPPAQRRILDLNSRSLQMLARDVDGIYHGTANDELQTAFGDPSIKNSRPALYYHFMDQPTNPWFKENILDRQDIHKVRARLFPIVFYE